MALCFHILQKKVLSGVISLLPMSVWWILKLKLATFLNGTTVIFIWKMDKIVGIKNIYRFDSNLKSKWDSVKTNEYDLSEKTLILVLYSYPSSMFMSYNSEYFLD